MRWIVTLAAVALVAGCKGKRVDDVGDVMEGPPPSALGCPEGAIDVGGRPPMAAEFWCGVTDANNRMVRHGKYWSFYSNGTAKEHGAFANGVKTGRWWYWDSDGELTQEGDYEEDEQSGYWLIYKDGRVIEEGPMKAGGRHGVWVSYDDATTLPQEGTWENGERAGVWIEYDAEGEALRERTYRNGRLVSQREL